MSREWTVLPLGRSPCRIGASPRPAAGGSFRRDHDAGRRREAARDIARDDQGDVLDELFMVSFYPPPCPLPLRGEMQTVR